MKRRKPRILSYAVCDRCRWAKRAQDGEHAIRLSGLHRFVTGHYEVYAIKQVK